MFLLMTARLTEIKLGHINTPAKAADGPELGLGCFGSSWKVLFTKEK